MNRIRQVLSRVGARNIVAAFVCMSYAGKSLILLLVLLLIFGQRRISEDAYGWMMGLLVVGMLFFALAGSLTIYFFRRCFSRLRNDATELKKEAILSMMILFPIGTILGVLFLSDLKKEVRDPGQNGVSP